MTQPAIETGNFLDDPTPLEPWDGVDALALMQVEEVAPDLFRNRVSEFGRNDHLYGGQVLAQGLAAAMATAGDRHAHSLHAYFLRAGSASRRILFKVDRTRDGGRFSTRRVTAHQQGKLLFHMDCSFRLEGMSSYDHQMAVADGLTPPEELADLRALAERVGKILGPAAEGRMKRFPLIEAKPLDPEGLTQQASEPRRRMWIRTQAPAATDDPRLHQLLLTYLSDYWLAGTALVMHPPSLGHRSMRVASLDHAMWFHRPVRADAWLLYDADSPSAGCGTGLTRGLFYDREGRLAASTAQEIFMPLP